MDFFGLQTVYPLKSKNAFASEGFRDGPCRMSSFRTLCLIVIFTALTGCFATKFGTLPEVDHLKTLRPGKSKAADVLLVVGEPRGHGLARFSAYPEAGEMWYYEYAEVRGSAFHLKILWVIFNKGTYIGHVWFSSNTLMSLHAHERSEATAFQDSGFCRIGAIDRGYCIPCQRL